jgi:hypothetical protein
MEKTRITVWFTHVSSLSRRLTCDYHYQLNRNRISADQSTNLASGAEGRVPNDFLGSETKQTDVPPHIATFFFL